MTRAAGSPGTAGDHFRVAAHVPYWNCVLAAAYCRECGDEWPCLPYREAQTERVEEG